MALANGSGAITGTYAYDVFGAVRSHSGGTTEFGFTGEQNDPNGLEYLRARYYDPATGRFMGRDPAQPDYSVPQTLSGWTYVLNNPANLTDPTGLCPKVLGITVPCDAKAIADGLATVALCAVNPMLCAVAVGADVSGVGAYTIVSQAVQIGDLVPVQAIPGLGPVTAWVSIGFDLAAGAFAQVDILLAGCPPDVALSLTGVNIMNVAVGLGGDLAGAVLSIADPEGAVALSVQVAAFETGAYLTTTTTIALQCG